MKRRKEKINVISLGCSKNLVDSEVLMNQLHHNQWELTSTSEDTDIAIINTCGFIEAAKKESIDTILQVVEMKRKGKLKKVVVMGCLSERYASELRKEIPEVDVYIGANKIDHVVRTLGGELKYELLGERKLTTPPHFAYLKISEGCDRTCAFCAIPLMRGKHVSKPVEQILHEAQLLTAAGVRELILIAQELTYYGWDLYGKRILPTLLEKLADVDGIEWIRLMYAYPAQFPLELLNQFQSNSKLCYYLDIPIQHISDNVLKSMRRGMSSQTLRNLLETIRLRVPDIALRTTLIVGYPNEGDREFNELLSFVREIKFNRLGVFTYSQEQGTTAYPLGDPVPAEVKEERRRIVMETQQEISRSNNESLIGKTLKVLIDQKNGDEAVGRTEYDAPEVDNEVFVHKADDVKVGHFYDVEIVDAGEYDLFAEPILYSSQVIREDIECDV